MVSWKDVAGPLEAYFAAPDLAKCERCGTEISGAMVEDREE